ncbi:hypothetical protein BC941DRAFT_407355 [Chlamydoabsidia padenii]|nr:hypothetical protein BC941DRAFT_407355 [Chlamydoabsidia padenii]
MSGIKRKQADDDWGLIYSSSSSGTDTDDDDDESLTCSSETSKRIKINQSLPSQRLTLLPHELLCEIFILSSNPHLPLVCRTLAYHLYHCADSVKITWLLYRHNNDIKAAFEAGVLFPFFTTRLLFRMDVLYQQQQQDSINELTIPYTKKKMPPHLFSREHPTEDTNALITLLLDRGGSPDKPKGYPLVKSAQFGRLDKVQQLIKYGANPTIRNNMALRTCAARNNMEMVLYFLDHLKVTPDSETLKECAHKKLWKMVQVLIDHGAVPDMNTVNFT